MCLPSAIVIEPGRTSPRRRPFSSCNFVSLVFVSSFLFISGCSTSGTSTGVPPDENPVSVGNKTNQLPPPPAQTTSNEYAGVDVSGHAGDSWTWSISQPGQTYNYQVQAGASENGGNNLGYGVYNLVGDFEFFSNDSNYPFSSDGENAEIPTGVALYAPAFSGIPNGDLVIGTPRLVSDCVAPDGSVAMDFIQVPSPNTIAPTTDALYGQATLSYKAGTYSYSNVSQLAVNGKAATTSPIPFADSLCVQALAGYGLQSQTLTKTKQTENTLVYLSASGIATGVTTVSDANGLAVSKNGFISVVEPSAPISISSITSGTYKGFYTSSVAGSTPNPAYFGQKSKWLTTPVFTQSGSSLIGGNESFYSYDVFPTPQVVANLHLDLGTQDGSHNGLFPHATLEEQDPSSLCPAKQQSQGSDGLTYCTFPVVAMVSQLYDKYAIFVVGPEPTTGAGLFYALVQD